MKLEVHRSDSGVLYWRDNCFWQLEITRDHETTGADVAAIAGAIRSISEGQKRPLLIYRSPLSVPSFEALTQFAKAAPELLSAVAYWVVTSQAARTSQMVREVFLSGLPVEVFSNEADAVRWIEQRLAEHGLARH